MLSEMTMKTIDVHTVHQLLVDDYVIEKWVGGIRVIHEWKKEERNPVFVKELAWEGCGPVSGIVIYDSVDGKFKMWYGTFTEPNKYPGGYAESEDGLVWSRHPHMAPDGTRGAMVMDPRGKSGDPRFLSACYQRPGDNLPGRLTLHNSCDGIRWAPFKGRPWWEGPSDVMDLMWDSKRACFVSYYKIWRVIGTTTDGSPIKAYFATFDPTDMEHGVKRIVGRELFPEIHEVTYDLINTLKGKDDGGGGISTDEFATLRVIGRSESQDFLHWTKSSIIFEPDDEDAIDVQYYGMPVFEYEGIYLALPRYFEGISGTMDVQFAFSRNGVDFTMPDKKLVLACGPAGSWDAGMVIASPFPLKIDGRLCLYYGAYNTDHTTHDYSDTKGATGRAWLREDGFASVTGGLLLTKQLRLMGKKLFINAAGKLLIKALDMDGTVIAISSWKGDSIGEAVVWEMGGIPEESVCLEFDLNEGHLYSFWSK